jgi:ABC-2 type transport system ATP-binding protein
MLRLANVSRSFGERLAVDGLSLTIDPGEIFGLLGPNGAGKTTTISMAVGLLEPSSGTVELRGHGAPTDPAARARVGLAPQALALYEDLSARENLEFLARLYPIPRRRVRRRADELLEFVGLTDRAGDRVSQYSGGMKRRLNLAAALVQDPDLILLDEPTVGVDPQSRSAIFDMVEELRGRGRTIVYTTHYMEEAQRLCDRVGIIDHGRLLALDTVDALIDEHGGATVVTIENDQGATRTETDDPVRELSAALAGEGVRGVRVARPDLESVFLALTGRSLRD